MVRQDDSYVLFFFCLAASFLDWKVMLHWGRGGGGRWGAVAHGQIKKQKTTLWIYGIWLRICSLDWKESSVGAAATSQGDCFTLGLFWGKYFLSVLCLVRGHSRVSSVVRASDLWSKGPGFESQQKPREKSLLQGQLSVLTLILVSTAPPCYCNSIIYIRSRPFCQKCRWQVTAKHTYTLPMWLWKKWHRKLVHGWMVYTELALRWQQFHVAPTMQQPKSAISTPLQWILKMCTIKGYSHSYRITWDTCTVNLLESRE